MRLQLKQFSTLSGLTALEAIRQPICLLLLTACCVFIALMPFLITHTLGESQRLVRDSALALHFVCGLLLGAFLSCTSLTRELERGTAAAILSKPVPRPVFFLAKFTGMAAVMLLFSLAVALTTVLASRVAAERFVFDWWAAIPMLVAPAFAFAFAGVNNYFTRRPFVSNAFRLYIFTLLLAFLITGFIDRAGTFVTFGSSLPLRILPASLLITFAILMLAAISLMLATRLHLLMIIPCASLIFVLGLISDYLLGSHAASNVLAAAAYYVIPNWQHFWVADALAGEGTIPWSYVGTAGIYALFYLAGILCLGILFFRQLEVKA